MEDHNHKEGAKIAIVGGGIIGLCIGLKMQQAGNKVTIFDKSGIGNGCSKGNAGHFATEQIFPLSTPSLLPQLPKMLLSPESPVAIRLQDIPKTFGWMVKFLWKARSKPTQHATNALKSLNKEAMDSWYQLLKSVGLQQLIDLSGSLLVFESESLFKAYQPTLEKLKSNGVECDVWSTEVLHQNVKNLKESVRYGVFFPNTGHSVEPYEMCVSLADEYKKLGGEVVEAKVDDISVLAKKCLISQPEGSQSFDKVIIATGAESVTLVKQITGIKVPLQAERGYHLMLSSLSPDLPMPISSADRKFIMTPMKYGLRLAGTVEYADYYSPANLSRARMLKKLARGVLKNVPTDKDSHSTWMGARPSLPDSLPVIDQNDCGKVIFAFGHQHLGLTQAAITADLVLSISKGEIPKLDLSPFSLDRFS